MKKATNILVVLLATLYFVAANGMVLQYLSQWYSTGGEVAIALHAGPSKDLPLPTLTERTYLPEWSPLIVPSIALLAHAIYYSADRPVFFCSTAPAPLSYTAFLSLALSDRAPPTA